MPSCKSLTGSSSAQFLENKASEKFGAVCQSCQKMAVSLCSGHNFTKLITQKWKCQGRLWVNQTHSCQVLKCQFLASIKGMSEQRLYTQSGSVVCIHLTSILPGWGIDHGWGKGEGSSIEIAPAVQTLLERGVSGEMVAVNRVCSGNGRQLIRSLLTKCVHWDFQQRREGFQCHSVQSARFCCRIKEAPTGEVCSSFFSPCYICTLFPQNSFSTSGPFAAFHHARPDSSLVYFPA